MKKDWENYVTSVTQTSKKAAHKEVLVVQGPFDKILTRKIRILNYA